MGFFEDFDRFTDNLTEKVADCLEQETYQKNCLPVVRLDDCVAWAKRMRELFQQSAGFIINVKNNPVPKNENDLIIVTVAMLDANRQPVIYDNNNGVSTLMHGRTIDEKLLNMLNGTDSIMLKF